MEYKRLYIAYGSNINLEQMANRCPNSKVVGKEMRPCRLYSEWQTNTLSSH